MRPALLEKSKEVPYERVLFGIGIRYVGETVAKKLAKAFPTIEKLMQATEEEINNVNEIGEKIAASIKQFFADAIHLKKITELQKAGLQFELSAQNSPVSQKLAGKSFVVSGVFTNFSRDGIKESIEANGGTVKGSVSKKIDFLLAGDESGPSKLEKAKKEGVALLTEAQYQEMIA